MPALRRSTAPVPRLTVRDCPGDAVTVLPPPTVRFVVPGVTAAGAGSAGNGTSGVTEPCAPAFGFTSPFTCRSPTLMPVLSLIESAITLCVDCTTAPLEMSMATPPERNGPLPIPRAPTSPPLTVNGALCRTMLLLASNMKSRVRGLAFSAALTTSVLEGASTGESVERLLLHPPSTATCSTKKRKPIAFNPRLLTTESSSAICAIYVRLSRHSSADEQAACRRNNVPNDGAFDLRSNCWSTDAATLVSRSEQNPAPSVPQTTSAIDINKSVHFARKEAPSRKRTWLPCPCTASRRNRHARRSALAAAR